MEANGGLGGSKLALADATEAEVLAGKKFYAGDKQIKTGTMTNNGAVDLNVGPGAFVMVPEGYHNGEGKVTAGSNTLKRVYLGSFDRTSFNGGRNYDYSAKSIPNYQSLTVNNFAAHVTSFYAKGGCDDVGRQSCTLTYNASTGNVHVMIGGDYGYNYAGCAGNVYCYYVG